MKDAVSNNVEEKLGIVKITTTIYDGNKKPIGTEFSFANARTDSNDLLSGQTIAFDIFRQGRNNNNKQSSPTMDLAIILWSVAIIVFGGTEQC